MKLKENIIVTALRSNNYFFKKVHTGVSLKEHFSFSTFFILSKIAIINLSVIFAFKKFRR